MTTEGYGRRIMGVGPYYRERCKNQVACSKCGEMPAVGSLSIHMMTQHGRAARRRRQWTPLATGSGPQSYRISFSAKGGPQKCPVEGCLGRVVKSRLAVEQTLTGTEINE